MNRIRAVILAISIALLPSMSVEAESTKKPDKDWVHGWVAEDEYLEKKREKEGKKGIMIRDFELYAAGAGIVTVLGVMIYLKRKSDKQ
jgi:hypothetical protein